jgi:hypothetical protein
LIENSIKIIDDYLSSIKLVIDNQEKSMKTRFYRQSTEKVKYCYFKSNRNSASLATVNNSCSNSFLIENFSFSSLGII